MKGFFARFLTTLAAVLACVALLAQPAAAGGLEGIPGYSHVFLVMLENESFSSTWGSASPAHYLNSTLVPEGVLEDQYYATGHVSLDNYVTLTSGVGPTDPSTLTDCLGISLYACVQTTVPDNPSGNNIADQLEAASLTWKGYMDAMPSPCFHQPYSPTTTSSDPYQGDGGGDATYMGDYADRHNPFNYYTDIVGNDTRCQAHVRPYTELAGDMSGGTVPSFAFITPDTCHDGHDSPCSNSGGPGGLASADAWLQANVPAMLSYLSANNGLLIITFDEGAATDTSGCCHGGPGGTAGKGGQVGLLAIGAGVKNGQQLNNTSIQYDHASLLRTLEDTFGMNTYLNNAASSVPMTDLFTSSPGSSVPDTPSIAALASAGALMVVLARRRRQFPRSPV